MATIREVFGAGADIEQKIFGHQEFVPNLDANYYFRDDLLRALLVWENGGICRNFLVQGPSGSGKSSLVEQYAARVQQNVYRFACHNRADYQDLLGQLVIKKDGSTDFVHGPLPNAMKNGGILLLDEVNFLHPGMVGALNTVLDGGKLLIPQTGEQIEAHPDFRIAATGNAIADSESAHDFHGVQPMNQAFLYRFIKVKVDYMSEAEEVALINRYAPSLPANFTTALAKLAADQRKAKAMGDHESVLSTRTVVMCARLMMSRLNALQKDPLGQTIFSLGLTYLNAVEPVEARAIEEMAKNYF